MSSASGSRDKILVSARELFYVVGYQATSVDDILHVCGVAKSNFYYHFKTKDDLAFAVLDMQIAEFERDAVSVLIEQDRDPAERFRRFGEALLKTQAAIHKMGGCPFGNFAAALSSREGDERTQRFRELLSQLFRRIETALARCLEDGVKAGCFRRDVPPDPLATTVLAAIEGLMLMTKTHRDTSPLRQGLAVLERLLSVH